MPITFFAFFATYDHCVDTSLLENEAPQPELLFPGAKVLGSEKARYSGVPGLGL